MKTYVVAGTYHEANYWIINDLGKRYPSNTSLTMSHYVYVSSPDTLKGTRDPHGVFIGNWMGRPDILEIVEELMITSTYPNPSLARIYKDIKQATRLKPTISQGTPMNNIKSLTSVGKWMDEDKGYSLSTHEKQAEFAKKRCWCHTCRPITLEDMRMVLCPECGNKRCPRATHHINMCTNSNDSGQEGSVY